MSETVLSIEATGVKNTSCRQAAQLQFLLKLAMDVATHDSLEGMLHHVVDVSAEHTGADRGTLFLNDAHAGELYSYFAHGDLVHEIRIPSTSGVAGHVFSTGIGAIVDDPYNDARFNPKIDRETGYLTRSLLCAPIRTAKGEIIGVLQMLNSKEGRFTEENLHLLKEMASAASIALHGRQHLERMKSVISRYMDPRLVDRLVAGENAGLGGKSAAVTVLFSDLRDFTSISEELGAAETVALLNEYFTLMLDCIHDQGGMVDKLIGDAIMAVFGLPAAADDADRAVNSAIAMMSKLRVWNESRVADGKKPIDIGIGLNTDRVIAGNIGSPRRMDHTIIGDGVNLASRLENACKQYGAQILISRATRKELKGSYQIREVDKMVVKGKTRAVTVYEVLDHHDEETFPHLAEVLELHRKAMSCYRRQQFRKAAQLFSAALTLNPNDKLSQIYCERVDHLRSNPPGPEWNGVFATNPKNSPVVMKKPVKRNTIARFPRTAVA